MYVCVCTNVGTFHMQHNKWQRKRRQADDKLDVVERNVLHSEKVQFINRTVLVLDRDGVPVDQ